MTRIELVGELKRIQLERLSTSQFKNRVSNEKLTREQLEIERKLAVKEYDPEPRRIRQAKVSIRPSPPLFVDTYNGPRCDFCSGPKLDSKCLNDSSAWPHPPGV